MDYGKIKESILKRSVLKKVDAGREDVLTVPSVGNGFAAVAAGEGEAVVLSAAPVTGEIREIGSRAVITSLNAVAVTGAEPIGVMLTILLPARVREAKLKELMEQVAAVCRDAGAQILGGHTEVSPAVADAVVTVCGVGKVKCGQMFSASGAKPGMDIVMTKWAGLEGTCLLVMENRGELLGRLPAALLDKAERFGTQLSVWREAAVAARFGVGAMSDVHSGGIFGALWEMAESSGIGMEIDLKKIPIRQETIEICEFFGINPYRLLSGGSILIASADGNRIVRELEKAQIPAVVIGCAKEGNDRVLCNGEERRFLEPPASDEWYFVREKQNRQKAVGGLHEAGTVAQ